MAKGKRSGKGYLATQGRTAPASVDSSMSPKGGSVNVDATRSGVASTPRTLGPRDA